jgi:general secretion pathway protein J
LARCRHTGALRDGSLQRWVSPATTRVAALQDSWLSSQQLQGGEPGQMKVLERVDGWQVYFYRGNAWTNAQSSGDVVAAAPPPPASGASGAAPAPAAVDRELLPGAVRLVLSIEGRKLTRDIALGPQLP